MQEHASQAASNEWILFGSGCDMREGLIDGNEKALSRGRRTGKVPIERRLDLLACARANAQGQHLPQLACEGEVDVGP